MQNKPLRIVPPSDDFHGIATHCRWRRDLRQKPAVRSAKAKLAVGLSIDLEALLVNSAVVPATEQGEIREGGGTPLGPVTDVMALPEADPAAREPAAAVSVMERPPERRRDRAGPGTDFHNAPSRPCCITTRLASHARR